jgi:hypothetical protein
MEHWVSVALELFGMMVGAGISNLVRDSVTASGLFPAFPILLGGAYVAVVTVVMTRLSFIYPRAKTLANVVGVALGNRPVGNLLILLTAVAYTAAGYFITRFALQDYVVQELVASCTLLACAIICTLLAVAPGLLQKFVVVTGYLEIIRFMVLGLCVLTFVAPAAAPTSVHAVTEASTLTHVFVLCVSSFGGFEASIQFAGARPRAELMKIAFSAVAATLIVYVVVAQAAVHALGIDGVISAPPTQIIPRMIDMLLATVSISGSVRHVVSIVIQLITFLTVINGAAGALKYSSSVIESLAHEDSIYGSRFLCQTPVKRTPLFVLLIVVALQLSSGVAVVELCGTLLVVVHLICAVALLRSGVGINQPLAIVAIAATCYVLLHVYNSIFDVGVVGAAFVACTVATVRWNARAN